MCRAKKIKMSVCVAQMGVDGRFYCGIEDGWRSPLDGKIVIEGTVHIQWSNTGRYVCLIRSGRICVLDILDGQSVMDCTTLVGSFEPRCLRIGWSPDDTWLSFYIESTQEGVLFHNFVQQQYWPPSQDRRKRTHLENVNNFGEYVSFRTNDDCNNVALTIHSGDKDLTFPLDGNTHVFLIQWSLSQRFLAIGLASVFTSTNTLVFDCLQKSLLSFPAAQEVFFGHDEQLLFLRTNDNELLIFDIVDQSLLHTERNVWRLLNVGKRRLVFETPEATLCIMSCVAPFSKCGIPELCLGEMGEEGCNWADFSPDESLISVFNPAPMTTTVVWDLATFKRIYTDCSGQVFSWIKNAVSAQTLSAHDYFVNFNDKDHIVSETCVRKPMIVCQAVCPVYIDYEPLVKSAAKIK
jgi:hypothetical protein